MNFTTHVAPSRCPMCIEMLRLAHVKVRERREGPPRQRAVLTWCLVCGEPATVEVSRSYAEAVAFFHALDRQPMVHSSNEPHTQADGWGFHWRLDEVLRVGYPVDSAHDRNAPYWPYPGWYNHTNSAENQVQVVTPIIYRLMKPTAAAEERILLKAKINAYPRIRPELERDEPTGRVWDENQFRRDFAFMGVVGPYTICVRRDTGEQGTLVFQDEPRFYWGFSSDRMI